VTTFYVTAAKDDTARTLWPYMPAVPTLLPAASFWDRAAGRFRPAALPAHITDRAADCGGFVATFRWGGVYPFNLDQYVAWLHPFGPAWAATMDLCCEDEITGGRPGIVRQRQDETTRRAWQAWQYHYDAPWAWVPTVQGWTVADYRRHAADLAPLVGQMQAYYATTGQLAAFRVGVGTLCRRASVGMIRAVVQAVAAELPGVPLHLWGVKLAALQSRTLPAAVASVDSAAWNGSFGRARHQARAARLAAGVTKRQYEQTQVLPTYLRKVALAVSGEQQAALWEDAA
jgi:hypothetical protein